MPSARFDFLYSSSLKDEYEENDRVRLDNMKEIHMSPFIVVNAAHLSPAPDLKEFSGVAQVPKRCVSDKECDHPTFRYVWNHILNRQVVSQEKLLSAGLKSFLIDLNIRADSPKEHSLKGFKIDFFQLDGAPLKYSNVEISAFVELYSEGRVRSKEIPNQYRFYFTGNIKDLEKGKEAAVLMRSSVNGLRSRFVEVRIKQGYTTFVDINLIS
ncbi:MAG: hypothetical protein KAR05_10085 [Candidatus Omnitrophica bacterium]|nr:hypothetical protein [Candidatus Omnitrophota bacterium]